MARTTDVIGYSYEADLHCDACALQRFPVLAEWRLGNYAGADEVTDREGNVVGEITRENVETSDVCGDCHTPLHPEARVWVIGSNMPGYLPDSDPCRIVGTFDDARAALVEDLERTAEGMECEHDDDAPDDDCDECTTRREIREALADELPHWTGPDSVTVGLYAYWITEGDVE